MLGLAPAQRSRGLALFWTTCGTELVRDVYMLSWLNSRAANSRGAWRHSAHTGAPTIRDRWNTSRSCYRLGAKMGSHSAKSRQESGGVWTVICPGKQHFANLLDSSRPARGLLHTEEVTR